MGILYERDGQVATITLDRPDAMNSLDPDMLQDFSDACVSFRDDPDAWVAIITGAGERAFCAGADLRKTIPLYADKSVKPPWQPPPSIMRGLEIWKPLIAAVNGMALGGGCEVALACDLRIASESATFGQPEVGWGLMPGWGGSQRLPRIVPFAKAAEMILTGATIDAKEAHRIGLVNTVVPPAELMSTARAWAEHICEQGPLGIRASKEALVRGLSLSLADGLRLEQALFDGLRQSDDFEEGPKAFSEKRKPVFHGR